METLKLKRFAQYARRSLIEQMDVKLKLVLEAESSARREHSAAVEKLEKAIKGHGKDQVIEQVAYIWFNRLCALRFMDVNRYNRVNVVSPADPGQFQPEILAEAKMGHIDEEMVPSDTVKKIFALLSGTAPSPDAQSEAYRQLVVAACNFWNKAMPFLFQRIDDYTELLMPDDLLSGKSILAFTREAMTPDACGDVEVIGWLYQFYISEKKDEVFDGLKKNKKITPENIPAATQLFTPHWIVRYLVENSLGRLWMLNRPGSKLVEQMNYYIKPEQAETDFLRISKPEEIKICDPACGSGHMLTYAFDLLYAIYEEEGYEPAEIPEKILANNLYGIEIDERAGELAAFALTMKARAKQRRFFNKYVTPNICVLKPIRFSDQEIKDYMAFIGKDLFTSALQTTLRQFEEADNFGSLIRPALTTVADVLRILEQKKVSSHLLFHEMHTERVLPLLKQVDYLSPRYHVVIANPPYMFTKGMNERLSSWAKDSYPNSKSDIFAMFIERNLDLVRKKGAVAMITMQSWMFLATFENLRNKILHETTLDTLSHLGPRAFDSIGGEIVQTCAFVLTNRRLPSQRGGYSRLVEGRSEQEKSSMLLEAAKNPNCEWLYRVSTEDLNMIPGRPFTYWLSQSMRELFVRFPALSDALTVTGGMTTADNGRFLRLWHEISVVRAGRDCTSRDAAIESGKKWFPYNKGGSYRKWFGNREYHVNWYNDGEEIISTGRAFPRSKEYYFKEALTYSATSSSSFGIRYSDKGFMFDAKGSSCFAPHEILISALGFLASKISSYLLQSINPTVEFQTGNLSVLPFQFVQNAIPVVDRLISIGRKDWDAYETSWDFNSLPLLNPDYHQSSLKATYRGLRAHWREMTLEMQRLEQENNRIFIDAYGLNDELDEKVELNEITLTCNPHYRYGNGKSEDELEALLLADTMRELVSYAVGCMFGRYALDTPGLILASQGETIEDYLKRVPEPSFPADDDNVIPMLDENWFPDDITERFRTFLKIAFGEEQFEANLKFIEKALGKDIRKFFLKDFYTDHIKRNKKRPIYWLFSSPKGSFNALIYMHRYRPDTISTVLQYLRDFRSKLTNQVQHLRRVEASSDASKGEKTKALKDIDTYSTIIAELDTYERDTLYPLATEQISIDLDDGVKVNYTTFGSALKKIPGLEAKEE
ncbi:MAG: BREX-1 system adenine-specific DNA-methyltransferase PglX [Candidatus Cloacimonetes bacterium]|nr:BREX-1 system adenine-specific DNA-methyltransferase PglX [Candidatus Cloacimonadota bacterium]MDY0172637.1 BREX-1 system adenine-specific DNA-methyltransferase PglX [Candidatus Cloacimonadaceae bacterium]